METIELIPFGIVLRDRYELMKKYKLVDMVAGFSRMTEKARKHYDPVSFLHYLQGRIEKPARIDQKEKTVAPPDPVYFKDQPEKNKIVQEILAM
jgi:hypothetical protein